MYTCTCTNIYKMFQVTNICILLILFSTNSIAHQSEETNEPESYYFRTLVNVAKSVDPKFQEERKKAINEHFHPYKGPNQLTLLSDMKSFVEGSVNMQKFERTTDSGHTRLGSLYLLAENAASSLDVSIDCLSDMLAVYEKLNSTMSSNKSVDNWAVRMLDAFGKPGAGILDGNIRWLGSYDQCLAIEPDVLTFKSSFQTQYCTLNIPVNFPMSLGQPLLALVGTCFPGSCTAADIKTLIDEGIKIVSNSTFDLSLKVGCQPRELKLDGAAKGVIVLLSFLGLFILVGTLCDIYREVMKNYQPSAIFVSFQADAQNEKIPLIGNNTEPRAEEEPSLLEKIFISFSIYTNGRKLLSTNVGSGTLTAVNGIRFLSMSWVVLGHVYSMYFSFGENAFAVLPELTKRWTFSAISNATVSVDTFFTMSGLLLSYLCLTEMKKKGGWKKMNWFMFYFHRFWRLTPAYMLVIAISTGLSKYFYDGPLWNPDAFDKTCRTSWWQNLLYINNFFSLEKMCLGVSWYLANDMQFFIISPLMLIPLAISPILGLCVCFVFLLGSFIATGVIATHYDLPVSLLSMANNQHYMTQYYTVPWCRIGPYVVGIIAGYILYRKEGKIRMHQALALLGWLLAAVLACLVLYGLSDNPVLSLGVRSLYNTVHRSVWGACVCWVIVACATGYGGFVNTLLSWSPFAPLGRLTYCTYLTHIMILQVIDLGLRQQIYLTDLSMVSYFLSSLMFAMATGFVASLTLESPMMALEKVLFKKSK